MMDTIFFPSSAAGLRWPDIATGGRRRATPEEADSTRSAVRGADALRAPASDPVPKASRGQKDTKSRNMDGKQGRVDRAVPLLLRLGDEAWDLHRRLRRAAEPGQPRVLGGLPRAEQ